MFTCLENSHPSKYDALSLHLLLDAESERLALLPQISRPAE